MTVPTRNVRPSMRSDDSDVRIKFKLADYLADQRISDMLESILDTRINFALAGLNESDYGYMFDPEKHKWVDELMGVAREKKLPWYRTSREAIDAIYDDYFRDNEGNMRGDFTRDELYDEMNKRLATAIANANPEGDQRIRDKLVKGGILKPVNRVNERGQVYEDFDNVGYSGKNELYKALSFLAPIRTIGLITDRESGNRATDGRWGTAVASDLLEGSASLLNWPGKLLGRAVMKGLSKIPTKGVLGKIGDFIDRKIIPFGQPSIEGGFGNFATALGSQGLDQLTDPKNVYQSQDIDLTDASMSGAAGAIIPAAAGKLFGKNFIRDIQHGKPKLRTMMADSYNKNRGGDMPYMRTSDVSNDMMDQLINAESYEKFMNAPYQKLADAGFTHYATPKLPYFKTGDMAPADVKTATLDRLKRVTNDPEGIQKWADMNPKEVEAISKDMHVTTGDFDNSPYLVESQEGYAASQKGNPVSSYKSMFSFPVTKEGPGRLSETQVMQRYNAKRKANAERVKREALVKDIMKGNENARPKGSVASGGIDFDPKSRVKRFANGVARYLGYKLPPELMADDAYKIERNGIPLKRRD